MRKGKIRNVVDKDLLPPINEKTGTGTWRVTVDGWGWDTRSRDQSVMEELYDVTVECVNARFSDAVVTLYDPHGNALRTNDDGTGFEV